MRARGAGLILGAIALAGLAASGDRVPLVTPPGPELARTTTGGPPGLPWFTSRLAAAREALAWLRLANADTVARAIVAHWAVETGRGASECQYNLGGQRAFRTTRGPYFRAPSGVPFRAYPSLADGARAYVDTVRQGAYEQAWRELVNGGDPASWYRATCEAGWHPWRETSGADFASCLRDVERVG